MSLDEPRNGLHADMVENEDHPEWLKMARRQAAAESKVREAEARARDELESVDAEEARWGHRMRQAASERPVVHYTEPSWGRPA